MKQHYIITIYDTDKQDFDIDLYLNSKLERKNEGDIEPWCELTLFTTWEEAHEKYKSLTERYDVVVKFNGNGNFLAVTNKN